MRHQRLWFAMLSIVPVDSSCTEADRAAARPPVMRCCTPVVVDAKGKEIGDVIRYDDRFGSIQLNAFVSYRLAGGDTVPLSVGPEYILGLQGTGGSTMLFTTPGLQRQHGLRDDLQPAADEALRDGAPGRLSRPVRCDAGVAVGDRSDAVARQPASRHRLPLAVGRYRLVLAVSGARLHVHAKSVRPVRRAQSRGPVHEVHAPVLRPVELQSSLTLHSQRSKIALRRSSST